MQIKTLFDLMEWTRALHQKLASCLTHCATQHPDEGVSLLLSYLAAHESSLEKMVATFARETDLNVGKTYVYDYLPHHPIKIHIACDAHYIPGRERERFLSIHD
ncbi:MAG: hypothetical protein JJU10_05695 [Idiomarina sp.]|nr:hypothetical protein [Idiomarina sp.]